MSKNLPGTLAKQARKHIPNAFFDVLLPRERLAVIRVVVGLLFYSIQWGPGGERKVLARRNNLAAPARAALACRPSENDE